MINFFKKRQLYLPNDVTKEKIRGRVVSGSLWSGIDSAFAALISFIRSIILARLLAPADFGIVAIATVFTQFVLIFANFGFTASIIYQRNLRTEDVATCWWGNFIVDLAATLICIGFALLSRKFTATPQTPWIIVILSFQFLINSLGSINLALLQRLFQFKTITLVKMFSYVFGFIVTLILVVTYDLGVYGLALGMVAQTLLNTLLYFVFLPWLPSRSGSFAACKKHLKYGGWFLGVNVITYANGNMGKVSIGAFLDNTQLGYYEYASRFPSMIVGELGMILNRVLFSAFSTLQNNMDELRTLVTNLFRYNALLIYPLLIGLAAVARDFVIVFYGEKWIPIILPMQLLCAYGVISIFSNPLYALANGIGKPSLPFKWTSILLPVNAVVLYLMTRHYGLEGVAVGKSFLSIFMVLTLGIELAINIQSSLAKMFLQAVPALGSTALMTMAVLGVRSLLLSNMHPSMMTIVVQVLVGAVIYIGAVRLFWPADFRKILGVIVKR